MVYNNLNDEIGTIEALDIVLHHYNYSPTLQPTHNQNNPFSPYMEDYLVPIPSLLYADLSLSFRCLLHSQLCHHHAQHQPTQSKRQTQGKRERKGGREGGTGEGET